MFDSKGRQGRKEWISLISLQLDGVARCVLCSVLTLVLGARTVAAADYSGQVSFNDFPVPGATVTVTRVDDVRTSVTDAQGLFRFADLGDGSWAVQIEMLGFSPLRQDVVVSSDAEPGIFVLTLLPFEATASGAHRIEAAPSTTAIPAAGAPTAEGSAAQPPRPGTSGGFQRAEVNVPAAAAGDAAIVAGSGAEGDRSGDAADGFLINGSVNNGAASPFAQLVAFGNNRRGARSLYNGGIGVLLGNSAWAAAPYSFTDRPSPKPDYYDAQIVGSFAGPVKVPGLPNRVNLFAGYQHTDDHNATTQSGLVPTLAERRGDFSESVDASGRLVRPVDPVTGLPFPGNVIPQSRISPQASSLLRYYPAPNIDAGAAHNYETPVVVATHQDALQLRLIETLSTKNQLFGNMALQRTATDSANLFGFVDSTSVSGIDAPVNWNHRFSQFLSLRLRYQYTRLATDVLPNFANRENVSGNAGISGNNQDPVNWGPPALTFSSAIAGLATAQYARNRDRTHALGAESIWSHGKHTVTAGGDARIRHFDVVSQQNARGTFTFTGAASRSDLADFLLGLPHSSTIAFGNADKFLQATGSDLYVTDDLRLSPVFTANIGLRWEYESPFTELYGRLVNLDLAPGFAAASPVVASDPVGSLTGTRYPASLLKPDMRGFQPRIGIAWRPVAGSSLVVRGGYGIYRNSSVYQAMTLLLAQQPPLSTASSVETSSAHPLTLANGFVTSTTGGNTFAVDPDLRVGYAHNWQLLVQRDLPASLTLITTYLGTKSAHLMQEILPNTYPVGAANPCPACPIGFVFLTSNGSSSRHAGQVQVRRRLHNGFSASAQYTLAKATDDAAAAFLGATLNGAGIAQNWHDPGDERALSSFDQRHAVTAQVQYTSGIGVSGGTLARGVRGALLKGWTVTSQMTAASGLPLTPIVLTSVPTTGVTGTIRADYLSRLDAGAPGYYANPAAFVLPRAGQWGNAGRNTIRGPAQFSSNASVGRSFLWGDKLTLDWRLDVINVLNHVTFTNVNTIVGSPQFGLPVQASTMRKVNSSLRLRF